MVSLFCHIFIFTGTIYATRPTNSRIQNQAAYWSRLAYFEESVVYGLMWWIEVALVHGCHLPVHFNVLSVKTYQPLSSYIYREAVCLFNIFYWIKNSLDIVVVDCPDYCHLNGLPGKIQCFNKQTGLYIVAINSSGHCSSGSTTVIVHLCPYNMEPLYQVTEPGIKFSSQVKDEEVVSIPNIFSVSEATNSQICVKFHWQVFE